MNPACEAWRRYGSLHFSNDGWRSEFSLRNTGQTKTIWGGSLRRSMAGCIACGIGRVVVRRQDGGRVCRPQEFRRENAWFRLEDRLL